MVLPGEATVTVKAKNALSSAEHLIYELGCSDCAAGKGEPCRTPAGRVRRWHVERIESAERHYKYGHAHGSFCDCGL